MKRMFPDAPAMQAVTSLKSLTDARRDHVAARVPNLFCSLTFCETASWPAVSRGNMVRKPLHDRGDVTAMLARFTTLDTQDTYG
jgi:hypothetical protein